MAWPILAGYALATATAAAAGADQLTSLSIEELAELEVTTAGKRPEPLSSAPATLFVITNEDVIRSGATSLPEILRLAPNLDVQQIDARQFAVTARGFQGYETANKLLVQIDGRTIYSTLFSGVYWDLFDTPPEDIERIEVVSGPGGTLYGANAMNGVVNITTKDSRDTLGLLARATAGNLQQTALIRYGGPIGADGAFRVYAEGSNYSGLPAAGGRDERDGGQGWQTGFRSDFGSGSDRFTLQGDAFRHYGDGPSDDGNDGQNILGRWTHDAADESTTQVQTYYSRYARRFVDTYDRLEMADLSLQHNRTEGRHAIVLGTGLRATRDKFVNGSSVLQLVPQSRTLWTYNVFAQDRIDLGDGLAATAGVKLEKTGFTGLEVLPSLRLAWQPQHDLLFYASAARAIREPSRIDRDLVAPGILETGMFAAEKLTALEIGYRGQPARNVSVSISAFYNRYDDLRTIEFTPGTIIPVRLGNGIRGSTWGIEAWANVQVTPWWRVTAGIVTLDKDFRLKPGATDLEPLLSAGNDSVYNLQLASRFDVSPTLGVDLLFRRYGARPRPHVAAYSDVDARIGWRVSPDLELYVAGANLLHDRRDDVNEPGRGQLVRRSAWLGARLVL